jgi:hypothetical protein
LRIGPQAGHDRSQIACGGNVLNVQLTLSKLDTVLSI